MPLDPGRELDPSAAPFFLPPKIESRIDCRGSVFLRRISPDAAVVGRITSPSTLIPLKLDFAACELATPRRILLASEFDRPKNDARLRTLCRLAVSSEGVRGMPVRLGGGEGLDALGLPAFDPVAWWPASTRSREAIPCTSRWCINGLSPRDYWHLDRPAGWLMQLILRRARSLGTCRKSAAGWRRL